MTEPETLLTKTDMDADELFVALAQIASRLRDTAAALDDGSMSKPHAANRLRKMARGIDGGN